MRLISQDGNKDFPYENVILEFLLDSNSVFAYTGTGQPFKIAEYSTREKASFVFDNLHNAYRNQKSAFYFPEDDEVNVDEA